MSRRNVYPILSEVGIISSEKDNLGSYTTELYKKRTKHCPGALDGGSDDELWNLNKPESYAFKCMRYTDQILDSSDTKSQFEALFRDFRWVGNPGTSSTYLSGDLKVGSNGRYSAKNSLHKHTILLEANTTYRFKAIDTYGDIDGEW